jgi:hypothetical protein
MLDMRQMGRDMVGLVDEDMIARVFPSRTRATPIDRMAFYDEPGLFTQDITEVHVSITFTWDLEKGERLAEAWEQIASAKIGGPATGYVGGEFTPGQYIKPGYVITSRGCPNRCWFCSVWKRDGDVRELKIKDGYNVLDDNLLACSKEHIKKVFIMLRRQKRPIEFTGVLEAKMLRPWIIDELLTLRLKQMFFAYDTPDDYEPLIEASKLLTTSGLIRSHKARCYVLVGYPKDTFEEAEKRLKQTIELGYFPMAMLWRDKKQVNKEWKRFQRQWARPHIVATKEKCIKDAKGIL